MARAKNNKHRAPGSVITSRGPQLRQGIVCKEWQRTPMQLLQEYCQSKQRKPPRYKDLDTFNSSEYRTRCILLDTKDSAFNLSFATEQSFASLEEAKHCSALLALFHLEPSLPLQRKLPDPFRDHWICLTTTQSSQGIPDPKSTILSSDSKFASKAERNEEERKKKEKQTQIMRDKEKKERRFAPSNVFMSVQCREIVESVLNRLQLDIEVGSSDVANFEVINAHSSSEKSAVIAKLRRLGFQSKHIDRAMQNCLESQSNWTQDALKEAALDWLLLHLTEQELPDAFNPIGTQLDVIVTQNDMQLQGLGRTLLQRLMQYNCNRKDAIILITDFIDRDQKHLTCLREIDLKPEMCLGVVVELYESYFALLLRHFKLNTQIPQLTTDEREAIIVDEIAALEAIYEESIQLTTIPCFTSEDTYRSIAIQVSEKVDLEFHLSKRSTYPEEWPITAIRSSDTELQPFLIHALGRLLENASGFLGGPMLYDIASAAESILHLMKSMGKFEPISLFQAEAKVPAPSLPELPRNAVQNEAPRKSCVKSLKKIQQKRVDVHSDEYKSMQNSRQRLPAFQKKGQFLDLIKEHQVHIVSGATGSGKSTQMPQYLLEELAANENVQIICTQPRRIAVIGLATRVAQERLESVGDVVGYQVRMDAKVSANTKLIFCTIGILLRRLGSEPTLDSITHIFVDEVHERSVETDFLLCILRKLLLLRPDLRIVLMSASMNLTLLSEYFKERKTPVLEIPGLTFPVQTYFLEDILDLAVPEQAHTEMKKEDSRIRYDLIANLVAYLCDIAHAESSAVPYHGGAILIFLPGKAEITRMVDYLNRSRAQKRLSILTLHGNLSFDQQKIIFEPSPRDKVKVIVSTNVAETSITISDVTVVIDSGKVKEMVYQDKISKLQECWISKAACKQRRGRAGRVRAGLCFSPFSKAQFDRLESQTQAEIHRVPLQSLCLQIKALECGEIREFLNECMEPPDEEAIKVAINELIEIGAFQIRKDGFVMLTALGSHLAMLPMDARIGKALIFGSILRCVEPIAIIAAGITSKPIFKNDNNLQIKQKQDEFMRAAGGKDWKSDHILLYKLATLYFSQCECKSIAFRRSYCRENGLSFDALELIADGRKQFLTQLQTIGFYDSHSHEKYNVNADKVRILKAALCAGLYGNIVQVVAPEQKFIQMAHGVMERDPQAAKLYYRIHSRPKTADSALVSKRVFIHPSSCNFTQTKYECPWLLYTDLMETSRIFVYRTTMLHPYALLLFGGSIKIAHDRNLLIMDEYIRFSANPRIGILVRSIQNHLNALLLRKLDDPLLDIGSTDLLSAITHLLNTQGM